ncbi:autotransporter outer membrane beta-barrel domain-containing protein [Pseudomonas sp. v388]|uniref:autotransporter family protein n=1 Tax=Pseudomonas sp. v388 TaxID=2479849 RepID=UPI000F7925EB|nr:autotransporter outer membrane beta-barrel domain-containing protein [Pseudomonas sp. v388]RRV10394.1 autotransporter outer membrane beta-barrel domain-containing protein [Pseudomonas sp. v388]
MKLGFSLGHALKIAPVTLLAFTPVDLHGACTLVATSGDDVHVCDSGNSGPLTDTAGNNSLGFAAGGTGAIGGNVTFGDGQDRVDMASGRISGSVGQAGGADSFVLGSGLIGGDVNQGSGIDTFTMSGGSLRSLYQGDGLDRFTMTGGTISNAFEDGDSATMSGGSIGRVDMKLDDNQFQLSGGRIVGNLVTGFGRDTIIVSGGSIGGAISVSGGDDSVSVSGGEVLGEIRTSFGNDLFNWSGDGALRSNVLLAEGNDTARLENLDQDHLSATPLIAGGLGNDALTLVNTSSAGAARFTQWESASLTDGSTLALAEAFTLGDSVSGSGTLAIDPSSTLASTSGSVLPFLAQQLVTVTNAGTLDMTTGSSVAGDTLRIDGNYVGNNGQLWLQSVLADDASTSDRLIVARGRITGTTQLTVANLGGAGALTQLNGIEVVQASEGAISDASAFSLRGALSAGAYQYYLFKGGATAGSENSWFLRSAVVSPPAAQAPLPDPAPAPEPPPVPQAPGQPVPPTPAPPPQPAPVPQPDPGPGPARLLPVPAIGTPPLPAAVVGAEPIALYRVEVPTWSVVPSAAAILALTSLGTFHERQGDQSLLRETGAVPAGWTRLLGDDFRQRWSGTVSPTLDATLKGYQIGHDLYAHQHDNEQIQRAGLFVAHSRLDGDVKGFAQGHEDRSSGKLDMQGDSLGAYWTLTGPGAWYVDVVLMGTRLEGRARSERGVRIDTEGEAFTASIETGYPFNVSAHWVLEPQAQWIYQRSDLDSQHDGISHLSLDSGTRNTGRLGARFKGRYPQSGLLLEPYVRANLWRTFSGEDHVTFDNADSIDTDYASTRADLGLGISARVSREVSFYAGADYTQNLDANDYRGVRGSIGMRVSW